MERERTSNNKHRDHIFNFHCFVDKDFKVEKPKSDKERENRDGEDGSIVEVKGSDNTTETCQESPNSKQTRSEFVDCCVF